MKESSTAKKKTKDKKENSYIIENPCCDEPLIKEQDGFFVCLNCGMVYD